MKYKVAPGVKLYLDGERLAEGDEVTDPPQHLVDLDAFEVVKAPSPRTSPPKET